jgi:hypothetical protein
MTAEQEPVALQQAEATPEIVNVDESKTPSKKCDIGIGLANNPLATIESNRRAISGRFEATTTIAPLWSQSRTRCHGIDLTNQPRFVTTRRASAAMIPVRAAAAKSTKSAA